MAPFFMPVGITAVSELPLVVRVQCVSQGYGSQEENPGLEVSRRLENGVVGTSFFISFSILTFTFKIYNHLELNFSVRNRSQISFFNMKIHWT